jgi:hypothetical protein
MLGLVRLGFGSGNLLIVASSRTFCAAKSSSAALPAATVFAFKQALHPLQTTLRQEGIDGVMRWRGHRDRPRGKRIRMPFHPVSFERFETNIV